jgi:hypothetical protein
MRATQRLTACEQAANLLLRLFASSLKGTASLHVNLMRAIQQPPVTCIMKRAALLPHLVHLRVCTSTLSLFSCQETCYKYCRMRNGGDPQ